MKRHVKKALAKINSIDMFSKEGWAQVHKCCRAISKDDDESILANGFSDFLITWYEDNDIAYEDVTGKEHEEIQELLLDRYVDYLLHD